MKPVARTTATRVSTHTRLPGDEAERCSRLGYIAFGELLAEGTAAELLAQFQVPKLEDVFIKVMENAVDPR